jgi:hypothetical protein
MYVSLETLRRTAGLVDSLAELDDPAGFAAVVLPACVAAIWCRIRATFARSVMRRSRSLQLVPRPARRANRCRAASSTRLPPLARAEVVAKYPAICTER